MKFRDIPSNLKPRERLIVYGKENLSDEELLSIILKTGTKNKNVKELSLDLLSSFGSLKKFRELNYKQLIDTSGIGKAKACEILAVVELGKRIFENITIQDVIECINPVNIINYFHYLFDEKKQECFYVLYLDNKKNYIDKKLLFMGSINYSTVHPREIFKEAYLLSSSFIICIHNHPSGDATPSYEDDVITDKIKNIGLIHGIELIDHLIIGKNNYYSYYEDSKI